MRRDSRIVGGVALVALVVSAIVLAGVKVPLPTSVSRAVLLFLGCLAVIVWSRLKDAPKHWQVLVAIRCGPTPPPERLDPRRSVFWLVSSAGVIVGEKGVHALRYVGDGLEADVDLPPDEDHRLVLRLRRKGGVGWQTKPSPVTRPKSQTVLEDY